MQRVTLIPIDDEPTPATLMPIEDEIDPSYARVEDIRANLSFSPEGGIKRRKPITELERQQIWKKAQEKSPEIAKAVQIGPDIATGALGVWQGGARYAERLGVPGAEKAGDFLERQIGQIQEHGIPTEDRGFIHDLASAAGSMVSLVGPSMTVANLASRIFLQSPRLAMTIASVTATGLESAMEGGGVYDEMKKRGFSETEAKRAADVTLGLNAVLVGITNKLGIFGEQARGFRRFLMSSVMEGLQESGQSVISQRAMGDKIDLRQAGYEGLIGAVLGGATGAVIGGVRSKAKITEQAKHQTVTLTPVEDILTEGEEMKAEYQAKEKSRRAVEQQAEMQTEATQPVTLEPVAPVESIEPVVSEAPDKEAVVEKIKNLTSQGLSKEEIFSKLSTVEKDVLFTVSKQVEEVKAKLQPDGLTLPKRAVIDDQTLGGLIQDIKQGNFKAVEESVQDAIHSRGFSLEEILHNAINGAKGEGASTENMKTAEAVINKAAKPPEAPKVAEGLDTLNPLTLKDIFKEGRKTITEQELLQLPDVVSGKMTPEDMKAYLETKGIMIEEGKIDIGKLPTEAKIEPAKTIPVIDGKESIAYTPQGDEIQTQYAITDIGNLTASHDEYGNVNHNYPQELQPRARDRKQLNLQVQQMANNIKPELIGESANVTGGAPIIGNDGIVESGNGRVSALRIAYDENKAGHYKQWLIENAERFGLDPNKVRAIDKPVLVRKRTTDVNRAEFARKANQTDIALMSPAETAKSDAQRISPYMLSLLNIDVSGNVVSFSNRQFVSEFLKTLGTNEMAGLLDNEGNPTRQMSDRIRAAIFSKAYGDDRLASMMAEDADVDIKTIIDSLTAGSSIYAKINSSYDTGDIKLIKHLADAAMLVKKAKDSGFKSVSEYIKQQGLFDKPDPITERLSLIIDDYRRSKAKLSDFVVSLGQEFKKELDFHAQDNMFGVKKRTEVDIISEVEKRIRGKYEQEGNKGRGSLFDEQNNRQGIGEDRGVGAREDKEGRTGIAKEQGEGKAELFSVGSNVRIGKNPSVLTIVRELPPKKGDLPEEKYFEVRNKEGEIETYELSDLTPVKTKKAKKEEAFKIVEDKTQKGLTKGQIKDKITGRTEEDERRILEGIQAEGFENLAESASHIARRNVETEQKSHVSRSKDEAQRQREQEVTNLEPWIVKNNLRIPSINFTSAWQKSSQLEGAEHKVLFNHDDTVTKQKTLSPTETYNDYLTRLKIHNKISPAAPYELLGFSKETDAAGNIILKPLVKQPFIDGRAATMDEIDAHMHKLDFEGESGRYTDKKEGILVHDVGEPNAKVDADGNVVLIDPRIDFIDIGEEGFISLDVLTLGTGRLVEAAEKLIKNINPKAAENVDVIKKKDDLGFVKAFLASPGRIVGGARYYVVHGKNAIHKQDRLRGIVNEKMNEIFKPLRDKYLRAEFEALSWMGDAEGKTYTAEELDEIGVSLVVRDAYLKQRKLHNQVWRLLSAHRKAYGGEMGYKEGHIPHLFENWNVYEMKEETIEAEEGTETREVPGGIVGTFRSLREATAYANGLDPNKKYLIKPKTFRMPDELIAKTVLKDASYFKLVEKLEKSFELTREEAFEMTNELARRKNRRRFFGSLRKRKGQTGFRQDDLHQILKEYYNSVARYVTLDDFKAKVIPKFEKDFGVEMGRADQALRDKNIARYVQEYINDVNGVPGMVEDLIDASVKRYLGSFVRSERPTIWAVNKALHFTGVVKLGLFNLSSGVVNLTQLINTFSKVPVKHFTWAFEKTLHPDDKARAILRRVGVEFDLGLADTGGYSMTHKGGKAVRASMFFFSGAEHINRRVTALAAYRQARKDLGYSEKQARQYARELVDKTQYDYSVADTAKIFRSPHMRLLGQFKPFAIKQIEFITGLKGAENIKFWIPILLIAGTAGIPLSEGLSDLIEWLTGKNPLTELKAFLMRWAGDDDEKRRAAEIAIYGVGSQLGIDMSRRVGLGDVLPKRSSDLLGPTINTLMQAKKIMEKGDKTELVRSIAPSVGNLITAIETVKNDMEVRDPWKRQHLKYEATPGEVAVKGMGLRPLKEAKLADIEQVRQYETQEYTKLQQRYVDQAIEALMDGNAEGFVESIIKAAEKGVIIDSKSIENEILQRVLPQDLRMILKTRAIQRGDYIETLDFLREYENRQ